MPSSFLFYISGHGYGHARRMVQVVQALIAARPEVRIHIRSAAPAGVFQPLQESWIESSRIDAGMMEKDPLRINRPGTLQRLADFMAARPSIVAEEVAAVCRLAPDAIIADIPFLAGEVAAETALPCIGISNFTWDWIYDNLFGDAPAYAALAGSIVDSYRTFTELLRLPFGQVCTSIQRQTPMPLLAIRSRRPRHEVLRQLGLSPGDTRPRVLFGTRGRMGGQLLEQAATRLPGFLFLCPHEHTDSLPANAMAFALSPQLDFSDVLQCCDVVVSKLGYGMISECIATQTRLVWPPREGFAEDAVVAAEAPQYVPMQRIARDDYEAGRWDEALQAVLQLPPSTKTMAASGAEAIAEYLLK